MGLIIWSDRISSAIYGGFANFDFKTAFTTTFNNVVTTAKKLANQLIGAANIAVTKVKQGIKFFADWWKDDPPAATAGAVAAGLSLGVIIVGAATYGGAILGGIAALRTMRLAGWISTGIRAGFAFFALGSLIRFMIRGVQFLYKFNWNITDSGIREQQQTLINSLYGLAGTVVGSSFATLVCGMAPIAIAKRSNIVKVNPMVLAQIREVTEFNPHVDVYGEIYEEMMEAMKALVNTGVRHTAQILALESYKNVRKWIKHGWKNSTLAQLFPGLNNTIAKWGEEGSQPWSFASALEDWVESIPDKNIQNFTEELIESFMDTCTENAMVISYLF